MENEQFFGFWEGFSSHPHGFPKRFGVRVMTIHKWWGQQSKNKGGGIFDESEDAVVGSIILEDNHTGHYLLLSDLIPMNFFK